MTAFLSGGTAIFMPFFVLCVVVRILGMAVDNPR
jgi:hypothetical protein